MAAVKLYVFNNDLARPAFVLAAFCALVGHMTVWRDSSTRLTAVSLYDLVLPVVRVTHKRAGVAAFHPFDWLRCVAGLGVSLLLAAVTCEASPRSIWLDVQVLTSE